MIDKTKCKDRVFGVIKGVEGFYCINPDKQGMKADCERCVVPSFAKSVRIDAFFRTRKIHQKGYKKKALRRRKTK